MIRSRVDKVIRLMTVAALSLSLMPLAAVFGPASRPAQAQVETAAPAASETAAAETPSVEATEPVSPTATAVVTGTIAPPPTETVAAPHQRRQRRSRPRRR
jgi:hypothetical protein